MKSIDTFSELALSDLVLYSSWPPELASSFSALPPEAELELELVVSAGVEDELAAGGVSDAVEEELLFELPQPARTTTPISRDRTASARRGFD